MLGIKDIIETISPVLIKPTTSSITIGLSKRFILFDLMNKLVETIEEDPYLNFISVLKNYKVLGKFLYGTVNEFYRDRNSLYFKNFFIDRKLYEEIKADMVWLKKDYGDLKVTITKRGVVVYDNYQKNKFNVLLMTIHAGTWIPDYVRKKLALTDQKRWMEDDIDTHKLYCKLVLEKGGIWIDNKQSRFACDYNRHINRAIYQNYSEKWLKVVWKEELTEKEKQELYEGYHEFYFTLGRLIETYHFNIIFDAHSMKGLPGRPELSFGTLGIPDFYMPIVRSMQRRLIKQGYKTVHLNDPYPGGFILKWLSGMFPDRFIFSMEVNKNLYMTKTWKKTVNKKLIKVARDITNIFDIEVEENEFAYQPASPTWKEAPEAQQDRIGDRATPNR